MMKIVCSWCGGCQGTKEGGDGVTHTICPSCAEKERQKIADIKTAREWREAGIRNVTRKEHWTVGEIVDYLGGACLLVRWPNSHIPETMRPSQLEVVPCRTS
jgi:hypothetical protein